MTRRQDSQPGALHDAMRDSDTDSEPVSADEPTA